MVERGPLKIDLEKEKRERGLERKKKGREVVARTL